MTREMEYAKCMAVLRKMLRMGMISETEYTKVKARIMDNYMIIQSHDGEAA